MNYHIFPDDKYIDTVVGHIEAVGEPGTNIFLVRDPKPFRYLKGDYNYIEAPVGSDTFNKHVNAAGKGDKILIQFPHVPIREWLANFETEAKIGWIYWGNDFYANMIPSSLFNHFDPLTKAYLDSQVPDNLSRFRLLSEYRKWKRNKNGKDADAKFLAEGRKAASKISYIFHHMIEDFRRIQEHLKCPAEFIYYYPSQPTEFSALDEIIIKNSEPPVKVPYPKKIWVGNCGYRWVNHLDTFEQIKNVGDDVAVCVPLSYGEKEYTEYVVKEGKRRFGARFIPFMDYMSFEDFTRTLHDMDAAIMGHSTPWAMGNLAVFQYFGKKIYIKSDLPSFNWFKVRNMTVGDYYTFDPIEAFIPLPDYAIAINRMKIAHEYSMEGSRLYIKRMLEL